ncbi:acyltransferase [Brasilonema octagenarum UFV-E1]|uniref:Acyltransferase n=1 Tax=Brasilonema sennae CENA114 TaxID=415709 RepID=A0A856MHD9_9CYAN|nr:acyltransferase [Brasilonema sennae]QDL10653.1 acyltransferase [Brasilonema sennae CENA114]QDL17000.1 acyltransferase [Brasilonema octagenarum UFV-E1]
MEVLKSGKSTEQRLRLHFLDGLRGLASLYVVLVHIQRYMGEQVPVFLQIIGRSVKYGNFAVAIFIVLSGFVLMLPVARSQKGYLPGGFWDYIQRRSRRILPPYYAALFFSLLTAVIILGFIHFFNFKWHESPEYGEFHAFFSPLDVITHLLLIHNFTLDTLGSINSPMWTVATEWQIYFLFPLLLLPIWRRFGLFSAVISAFLISVAPLYLLNGFLEAAHPWFLGLFALGMAAADIIFSEKPKLIAIRNSLPWNVLAIVFIVLALIAGAQQLGVVAMITGSQQLGFNAWISDSFCGLATACLLVYCSNSVIKGKNTPLVLRLFESRWAIALSTFSYSLYLTHGVVVTVVGNFLLNLHMPPTEFITIFYLVALPLSLLIGYLFYLVFERPFMSNFLKKRKVKDAVN